MNRCEYSVNFFVDTFEMCIRYRQKFKIKTAIKKTYEIINTIIVVGGRRLDT